MMGMKSAPPKAETVGEILCKICDAGPMGFENHTMTKTELTKFLSKGRFITALNESEQKLAYQQDKTAKGGPIYCSGVFATTEGRVFEFRRPNTRFLEIVGVDGVGFLLLEGQQDGGGQPATKPADKPPVKGEPSTPTPKDGPR